MPVFPSPSGLHFMICKMGETGPMLPKDGSRCFPGVKQQLSEGPHSSLGAGKRFCSEGKRLVGAQAPWSPRGQCSWGPTELSFLLNELCSLLCSAAAPLGLAPMQERSPDSQWDTRRECPAGALWPSSGPGLDSRGEEVSRSRGLLSWLEHGNSTSGTASATS